MSRPRRILAAASTLLLLTGAAGAAETAWVGTERGAVKLVTAVETAGSRRVIEAGLQLRLAPGWYTYWRSPGDAGVAPRIDWAGSENVAGAVVAWPAPSRIVTSGLRGNVYIGELILPVTVMVTAPGAAVRLRARIDYGLCAKVCIPARAELSLDLPAGPEAVAPEAAALSAARARLPVDLASAGLRIVLSRRATGAAGSILTLMVRSELERFAAPQLFVEGAGPDEPASTVRLEDEGRAAWLRIVVPRLEADRPLALTLVDGDRAATWTTPRLP